ncbi:hypothetical protein C8Q77DRAFT_17833 [Trametes polyzona]|nr:hypothetical protein C8Q77DRAFT_17833 [Trametes polyzona]
MRCRTIQSHPVQSTPWPYARSTASQRQPGGSRDNQPRALASPSLGLIVLSAWNDAPQRSLPAVRIYRTLPEPVCVTFPRVAFAIYPFSLPGDPVQLTKTDALITGSERQRAHAAIVGQPFQRPLARTARSAGLYTCRCEMQRYARAHWSTQFRPPQIGVWTHIEAGGRQTSTRAGTAGPLQPVQERTHDQKPWTRASPSAADDPSADDTTGQDRHTDRYALIT